MLQVALRHAFAGFTLDVAFDAPAGIAVLVGRSGSGKTTLLNAVAELLRPDAGRVAAGDWVLLDTARGIRLPPCRRRLGYVFQEARLFPHLNVRQNLAFGNWIAPRDAVREDMGHAVEMLGNGLLLNRRPGVLSGDEKHCVAIGRGPPTALDEAHTPDMLPYFEPHRDAVSVPILYVSHAPGEVARLVTTMVAHQDGRVFAQGSPWQVMGDPAFTPLGAREAGALIAARIVAHHDDGPTELAAGPERMFLPRLAQPVGAGARLLMT